MNPCGLHFLIGNKGACKSMLACKMSWRLVAESNRVIVTNLPVVWPGLEGYMQETYPSFTGRVRERVWVIEDIRLLCRFWLHRGFGWTVPDVREEEWSRGRRLDFRYVYRWAETVAEVGSRLAVEDLTSNDVDREYARGALERKLLSELPPVQYVIDEIQNVFPSRAWQKLGPQMLFYLTQQRKFGDDIIAISQRPGLMDKQLRELCDDWLFLTNWGRKQKGWFRLPSRATWAKFDQLPAPGVRPMVTGNFSVDVLGVGQTYDTSAGVGIEGGLSADKGAKPSGFHWAWLLVVAAVAVFGVMQMPGGLTYAMGWVLGTRDKGKSVEVQKVVVPAAEAKQVERVVPSVVSGVKPAVEEKKSGRVLTGFTTIGGVARFWFSDGEYITNADLAFQGVLRRGGQIAGVRAWGREYVLPGP